MPMPAELMKLTLLISMIMLPVGFCVDAAAAAAIKDASGEADPGQHLRMELKNGGRNIDLYFDSEKPGDVRFVQGDLIILFDRASAKQANGISITGGLTNTQVPGFNTQGAQVAVQVEDGQTIAIGGLIQHTVNATNAKVPVLGDVPFLGAAFRTVNYDEREQELIILVTPRLVDPMGCDQLPGRLPTRLTRTPDDFELYLEGVLELPRGQRQTCGDVARDFG